MDILDECLPDFMWSSWWGYDWVGGDETFDGFVDDIWMNTTIEIQSSQVRDKGVWVDECGERVMDGS